MSPARRDEPSGPPQCFNCGADTRDWDFLGDGRVWVCGDPQCHRELRDENRGIVENAMLDAAEDEFRRYW